MRKKTAKPQWMVRVEGHADGLTFVGPFVDKGQGLAWLLITLDGLPEFTGYTSACVLPLTPASRPYTV